MKNQSLLSADKFAKLCGITKDTLRHYNNIGILTPVYESESHYKYYAMAQTYTFDIIKTLTDIGCPLNEIKTYLATGSEQIFLDYLKQTELELSRKRKRLLYSMFLYERTIDFASSYKAGGLNKPTIISQPAKELLLLTAVPANGDEDAPNVSAMVLASHNTHCQQYGFYPFPIGHLITRQSFDTSKPTRTHLFTQVTDSGPGNATLSVKPPGDYLTIVHNGPYKTLPDTYRIIADYIEEHHLILNSDLYVLNVSYHIFGYENQNSYYYVSVLVEQAE